MIIYLKDGYEKEFIRAVGVINWKGNTAVAREGHGCRISDCLGTERMRLSPVDCNLIVSFSRSRNADVSFIGFD